jgi:hypothetical protein
MTLNPFNIRVALMIEYAGGISIKHNRTTKQERCFEVRHGQNGRIGAGKAGVRDSKCFSYSVYGGKEKAWIAAEAYRRSYSDQLGKTVRVYISNISHQLRRYIAGLIDGDGCIRHTGSCITVSIRQSQNDEQPAIITMLQKLYGGDIYPREAHGEFRKQHCLELAGYNCLPILWDILPYLVLKPQQARIAYEFLMARSPFARREQVFVALRDLKLMDAYQAVPISVSQLSDAYLSGFFDAEGCFFPSRTTCISVDFSQAQSDQLLLAISQYFGGGCVGKFATSFNGVKGYEVIERILPFAIGKRSQLEAGMKLRRIALITHSQRTPEDLEEAAQLKAFITSEKHK